MVSFQWNGNQVHAALRADLGARFDRAADAVVRGVQGEAPVRTGALRASVHKTPVMATPEGLSVDVVADAPYADYVDQGTAHHPPNPFFERGFEKSQPEVASILGH